MRTFLFFALVAIVATCRATSIIFPAFTTPIVKDRTLLALSPDRKRLLAFDTEGGRKWDKTLEAKASLAQRDDGTLWLLSGRVISVIDPATGVEMERWPVPAVDWLHYDKPSDLLTGALKGQSFVDQMGLHVLDGTTRRLLRIAPQGEVLAYADHEMFVLACGDRKVGDRSYSFSRGWLECYRRCDGKALWVTESLKYADPYRHLCRVGAHLVVADGGEWLFIDAQTGKSGRKPVNKFDGSLGPSGLREKDGNLVYTVSKMNMEDFKRSLHTITTVSVPDFAVISQTKIEVIEAGATEDAGEFLITDSLYRTACFRRDGSKVWEHFQMHRTSAIEGVIYFSDHHDDNARIGKIEIATGKESILHTEPAALE